VGIPLNQPTPQLATGCQPYGVAGKSPKTDRSPLSSQLREKHRSANCAGPRDIAAMKLYGAESIKLTSRAPRYPSAYGPQAIARWRQTQSSLI
jgi:hypothetical protein